MPIYCLKPRWLKGKGQNGNGGFLCTSRSDLKSAIFYFTASKMNIEHMWGMLTFVQGGKLEYKKADYEVDINAKIIGA